MKRVFLSYAKSDRKIAAAIKRALQKLGMVTFDSVEDVKAGEDWRRQIEGAIREADSVVVVVGTPDAAASSWIGYEVGSATALGKPVIVMKASTYSVGDLPVDLAGWQTVDFDPSVPTKAARILASSLAMAD